MNGNPKLKWLVIGVGNEYRRDDAVGVIVARKLKAERWANGDVLEQSGEGGALLEAFRHADAVIVVDAVRSGANPGTIYRFDARKQPLPAKFFHYSSHAFAVAEAIEMARALNQLPACLIVYGIEGKDFGSGQGLSWEVEHVVPDVVERIADEMKADF